MERENLAWAAGVICGEGSITFDKTNRLRLTVGQSSQDGVCPEMLLRLQSILGGRISKASYKAKEHHKTSFQFAIGQGGLVLKAVSALWEWLTPEKKMQAANAIWAFGDINALS